MYWAVDYTVLLGFTTANELIANCQQSSGENCGPQVGQSNPISTNKELLTLDRRASRPGSTSFVTCEANHNQFEPPILKEDPENGGRGVGVG